MAGIRRSLFAPSSFFFFYPLEAVSRHLFFVKATQKISKKDVKNIFYSSRLQGKNFVYRASPFQENANFSWQMRSTGLFCLKGLYGRGLHEKKEGGKGIFA